MPQPATALIADDEPHLASYLRDQLQAVWPELQVLHAARHGLEAAERIAALQPDIAFLDIQMPGLTGLEVAQGIEGTTRVVFVTAYDEFAVQAFEHAALDYVLKPVTTERLRRTVQRLQAALPQPPADDERLAATLRRLMGDSPGAPQRLLFFRADDKYTVVQTARAEHLIRAPIQELASQLDPQVFCQVHRSTLVNLAHLAGTRRDEASRLWLRMQGWDGELPVSRAYVHRFKPM
ncbi:MAG: DNA-binding response regulator [Burkholderiales bacterium PBB5]|nr:MAG: DNA-binding response regulator [Burkholderiales bacterium PBB5]